MVRNTHGHGHTTDLPGDALELRLARHFRERAEHTAIECGDLRMSYAQLEALAYGVVELLRDSGVRAGDVVPLCLPRSPFVEEHWLAFRRKRRTLTFTCCAPQCNRSLFVRM